MSKTGPKIGALLFGVAPHDHEESLRKDGKTIAAYNIWHDMVRRCYDGKLEVYKDVTICDEWLIFSNFKTWYLENGLPGYFLDKDILSEGRVYSPSTCAFVPRYVNNFLTLRNKTNPVGLIGANPKNGKFMASISRTGKRVHLGMFDTEHEAHMAWLEAKIDLAHEMLVAYETNKHYNPLVGKALTEKVDRMEKYLESGEVFNG